MVANGPRLVAQQTAGAARAQRRRQLRQRLNALIELADGQYRAQQWADFEETKLAIRLVLSDLSRGHGDASRRRVAERLPVSSRRGGARED